MSDPRAMKTLESPRSGSLVHPLDPGHAVDGHLVHFYDDDAQLLLQVSRFLADGLAASDVAIVIATASHIEALWQRLTDVGIDVAGALEDGRLTFLDAQETLSEFMRDGALRPDLFEGVVGKLIATRAAALTGSARLRAYAEMVDVLWREGRHTAALQLEELWNELEARLPSTVLCAHAMASFLEQPADSQRVCAAKTPVAAGIGGGVEEAQVQRVDVHSPYTRRLEREIARRVELEKGLRQALHDLRAKDEELRHRYRQMELITDALPALVAFIGADQRYQFASAAYERWFGHPRLEVIGRHLRDVLGPEAYEVIEPQVNRALRGEQVTFEAHASYRDGGARWIEATYIPQRGPRETITGFVALVADISEKKAFARFRAAAQERAERLLRITEAIATAVSAEEVHDALVHRVADAIDASSAGLWLIDETPGYATLVKSRGYSEEAKHRIQKLPLELSPGLPALDCIRTGAPIWIPSQAALLEKYPHLAPVATPGRSYRVACLPLVANQRVLGTLSVTIEEAADDTAEERELLLLVARYATQAIERLRILRAEQRSRADADAAAGRLQVLGSASRAFAESDLALGARLESIASELARTLDGAINIALVQADGLLHLSAVKHPDPEAQALLSELTPTRPLKPGEGVTGTIVATGESALLPVLDQDALVSRAPEAYRAFLERFPVYAMMGARLRVQGRVIGAVTAARVHEGQTYSQEDLRLLEELAERAAVSIENSRLYEESVAARNRAEALYRFAQAVVSADRLEQVFDAAIAAIGGALDVHRSAVLTFDDEGVMRFRTWSRLSDEYRRAVEGHSPWPRDVEDPGPVLVPDALGDPAFSAYQSLFRSEGIGALAFIPLTAGGRLLGKFMLYYGAPHTFAESELDMARAIANHLASVTKRFQAVTKLEETIRYNELFAGVLAHDLRNPLGAMMTAAQLLLMRREGEGALSDRETKPLGRIVTSGQRMATMIEQLLDFTRIRLGGGIPIEPHETNLADLCGQAVAELELGHPEWIIQRQAIGDLRGAWDSDRLLQVLSNLLANACQHGVAGVPVFVKLDGSDGHRVGIEIRNRGAIPASLLPHLFDPFRSTGHGRDQSRGLGLGLHIVREIVRGHGGSVEVVSNDSEDTTFLVRLPRRAERRAPRGAQP